MNDEKTPTDTPHYTLFDVYNVALEARDIARRTEHAVNIALRPVSWPRIVHVAIVVGGFALFGILIFIVTHAPAALAR